MIKSYDILSSSMNYILKKVAKVQKHGITIVNVPKMDYGQKTLNLQ